jgi:hypothetical protein
MSHAVEYIPNTVLSPQLVVDGRDKISILRAQAFREIIQSQVMGDFYTNRKMRIDYDYLRSVISVYQQDIHSVRNGVSSVVGDIAEFKPFFLEDVTSKGVQVETAEAIFSALCG